MDTAEQLLLQQILKQQEAISLDIKGIFKALNLQSDRMSKAEHSIKSLERAESKREERAGREEEREEEREERAKKEEADQSLGTWLRSMSNKPWFPFIVAIALMILGGKGVGDLIAQLIKIFKP